MKYRFACLKSLTNAQNCSRDGGARAPAGRAPVPLLHAGAPLQKCDTLFHEKAQAAWGGLERIQDFMPQTGASAALFDGLTVLLVSLAMLFLGAPSARSQDAQGPVAPPLPEHEVRRISNIPEPEAPPDLPPEEIIRRFAQKEDRNVIARLHYGYRKTIHIQQFGNDGKPSGEYVLVTESHRGEDGSVYQKVIQKPQSTLTVAYLMPEDLDALDKIPAYPLTTRQLPDYDVRFIGREQVDEIFCYIFQVKPKTILRTQPLFDGVLWVDAKYLDVVKTYGKWVTELGDYHIPALPFSLFETYRENVDGKYWFPDYSRSDDEMHPSNADVAVRITIKWSDFKPYEAATQTAAPVQPATAEPAAATPAKP
jgi:hypothetical protein